MDADQQVEKPPVPAEARVEAFLPLVRAIAWTVSRGLPPSVELQELVNDGVIGLMGALRRYDPARGVGFSAYAGHRIRGAMLDGLRTRDPLPRAIRRAHKSLAAAPAGIAPPRAVQLLELDQAIAVPDDGALNPEALAVETDLRRRVWDVLAALPPRDRRVITLRTVQGMALRQVATHMSLSPTRTAEIQARGLARMRRFLDGERAIWPRRALSYAHARVPAPIPRQEECAVFANQPDTPDPDC
jgi:RNA polymerase sigma factor for flagellar operon FliA